MQEIFAPGLGQALMKRLGMKPGATSPAAILTPEITPGIVLENDRPEWSFLAGESRVAAVSFQTLDAGGEGFFWIVNPAGSNVLAVIEHILIGSGDAPCGINLAIGAIQTGQDDQAGFASMDGRDTGDPVSPLLLRYKAGAAASISLLHHQHILVPFEDKDCMPAGYPIILPPGRAAYAQAEGVAAALVVCAVQGRVRVLQPNELVAG